MKLIKIQNSLVRPDHISIIEPSTSDRRRLLIGIYGHSWSWTFPDRKIARAERIRVIREWKAAIKPRVLKARRVTRASAPLR